VAIEKSPGTMRRMTHDANPPRFPSRYWADCTGRHFAEFKRSGHVASAVAVLPVAAIEQHGPHLPVSVDTTLVNEVIAASLPHLGATNALFLPTQQVGKSNEHARFAGTLTLSAGYARAANARPQANLLRRAKSSTQMQTQPARNQLQ
jgi:hypothetical protein